jgi:hypothetical protein
VSSPPPFPSSARRRFDRLEDDLRRVLQDRFVALVATSAAQGVAFATTIGAGDLEALGSLVDAWHRDELDTPLLMTADEFHRSLDVFPLEYQAIIDRHVVIAGTPPFGGVAVPAGELRRACEVQAKGHVIHLRQGWIEAAGHEDRIAALVARSAAPLRALLATVARLTGASADSAAGAGGAGGNDAAIAGARVAGLPEPLIGQILSIEDRPPGSADAVPDMRAYLAASERLWDFVDSWRAGR